MSRLLGFLRRLEAHLFGFSKKLKFRPKIFRVLRFLLKVLVTTVRLRPVLLFPTKTERCPFKTEGRKIFIAIFVSLNFLKI